MKKSIKVDQKPRRGRPATGRDPMVSARIPEAVVKQVDAWAASNQTTRSDAISQLVQLGLASGEDADTIEYRAKAGESASEAAKLAAQLGLKAKRK